MNLSVNISSNTEYVEFVKALTYNMKLKMEYDFTHNVEQNSFPLWNIGVSQHFIFKTRDEINITYSCILEIKYHLETISKNYFLAIKKYKIIYGISNNHPDNIESDLDSLIYFDQEEVKKIKECVKLIDFGSSKAIEKSIKEFEQWKEQEKKKDPEYLLKE
jgi:hypothetical protein